MRRIRSVFNKLVDTETSYEERTLIMLAILGEMALLVALLFDIIGGENIVEIITLALMAVGVAVITGLSIRFNKVFAGSLIQIICLVFIVLPVIFFFGGGPKGGGVFWIVISYMFIGMSLTGGLRWFMMVCLTVIAVAEYLIWLYHPEYIYQHTVRMFCLDAVVSVILVGILTYVMLGYQKYIFSLENRRAREEKERAEELTVSQNRFFSSMSHEIRTPINSILGLNELILRDETVSDEVVRDASGIQGAGKMLLALINDILDFSKMKAGSMDIVPVDYRVGELLSEIVNMVWLKAQDKGLKFEMSVDPGVPSVLYGDEIRIKQILINLLNNSIKYTSEGMVELHIESEGLDDDNVLLHISVSDTGMGIKKEVIPYLFDAFKRVDEERNRRIEGTGLGLSIVRQLAELMDGSVAVNSVYGEGSTFTVTIKQGISDASEIGELNIHSQKTVKRSRYESSFKAPEARILIVDDNEMNLEVERKILLDTEMAIDITMSGSEALEYTLKRRYDVILMDHLMPIMDGIECLGMIRSQSGGMNRTTPVIVLTANAGSDNRDLYNRSGFDGYLVKPVSGEALEDILMKHISKDKLIISNKMMRMREDINTTAGYARKAPVIISSTSMCDLPRSVIKKLNLPILPFLVRTDDGVFKDGVQMNSNELIRYINEDRNAVSSPPDTAAYTEFFANALKRAHHLIHIALTTSMSEDYRVASEAARSFDNVTVINSECLSSATGILVLIAYKLAQQNIPVDEIVSELETVKRRLRCSFIIDTTEYMYKKNLVSRRVNGIARYLNLHPGLKFRDDRYGISGVWMGNTRRAYRKYIHKAFPVDVIPDSDVAFITYADVPIETLAWIREEISRVAYFEHVVFQQASAAISSNCGPGSFGILYFIKSNKSYNIASLLNDDSEMPEERDATDGNVMPEKDEYERPDQGTGEDGDIIPEEVLAPEIDGSPVLSMGAVDQEKSSGPEWYDCIEGIDGQAAIKNSGSEDSLKSVLKMYYDYADDKTLELNGYYSSEDWDNYTIKVHALKSSSRLVGALELADEAQLLENAGKEGDIDFIKTNHEGFMDEYLKITEALRPVIYGDDADEDKGDDADKPIADAELIKTAYEELYDAADNMDCDMIGDILKELDEYAWPAEEEGKMAAIRECAAKYDYDGIIELLEKK